MELANHTSEITDQSPRKPCVFFKSGASVGLRDETRELLHSRLKALTILVLFGVVIFFIRRLFVSESPLAMHIINLVFYGGIAYLLHVGPLFSLPKLRFIELLIFAQLALTMMLHQYLRVTSALQTGNSFEVVITMRGSIGFSCLIMMIYSMFIPNTWWRTAAVVLPLALAPPFVASVLHLSQPGFTDIVAQADFIGVISENVLTLLFAAVAATFGSYTINSLRREAYEAKQMGQYHLKEKIGSGGMGEVYLAEHQLLKRPCAVKLIKQQDASDPRALARFEREVRTTASLSHPNTVDIYDYGQGEDGSFFYVMEYLPGLSLADMVHRYGALPSGRMIHLAIQTCDALTEAHDVGFIHRDIKPGNIFVAERGGQYDVAKLLDFGLVKLQERVEENSVTSDGALAGSPDYMAPELSMGEGEPDARSDIYALGAVMYYMLTGHAPFERSNAMQVLVAHAREPLRSPSEFIDDLPEDVENIVIRCLSKDPTERYPSATALAECLSACRDVEPWSQVLARDWWENWSHDTVVSEINAQHETTWLEDPTK